ncbi:MAG: DNA polymerase III subunit delta [Bacillota bacterium]
MRTDAWPKTLNLESLKPIYLLYGEEEFLVREAISRIRRRLGEAAGDVTDSWVSASDIDRIDELVRTSSLFGGGRLVLVENAGEAIVSSETDLDRILEFLKKDWAGDCVLVLICKKKPDIRLRTVKIISQTGDVVACDPLKGRDLNEWILSRFKAEGKAASFDLVDHLAAVTGTGLWGLSKEIEKLCVYSAGERRINFGDVKEIVSSSVQASVFRMLDAISEGDVKCALVELKRMLSSGEAPARIHSMIVWQIRNLYGVAVLYEAGASQEEIERKTGLHSYVVKKNLAVLPSLSRLQLENWLALCLEADVALKTGADARAVLQDLVVHLTRRKE